MNQFVVSCALTGIAFLGATTADAAPWAYRPAYPANYAAPMAHHTCGPNGCDANCGPHGCGVTCGPNGCGVPTHGGDGYLRRGYGRFQERVPNDGVGGCRTQPSRVPSVGRFTLPSERPQIGRYDLNAAPRFYERPAY